jgi:hypothetical protein
MNRLINDELKAKTAIELLNKLLDIIGEDALDIEPSQASEWKLRHARGNLLNLKTRVA